MSLSFKIPMIKALVALQFICVVAAQELAPAEAWREFSTWARQAPDYGDLHARYRQRLIADGLSEQEAEKRIELLRSYGREHREEAVALHFNKMYTIKQEDAFITEPNQFLTSVVHDLKPGAALDVCMGQGRNGVYLAARGWEVTGFDIAEDGLDVARAAAEKAGTHINAVNARIQDFDFGKERWDLVFFIYAFARLADQALVERVWQGLKPGGLVLIEHPMGEPDNPWEEHDKLNALPKAWSSRFRILYYQDAQGVSDWHQCAITKRRDAPLRIVRFLARKCE